MAFVLYVLGWVIVFLLLLLTVVLNRPMEHAGYFLTGWTFYLLVLIIVHLVAYVLYLARKLTKRNE